VRHLIATSTAWDGNPNRDAVYVNVRLSRNDRNTAYQLTVPDDVPVEAFWSVIVDDASWHLQRNDRGVYSFNCITARREGDGSINPVRRSRILRLGERFFGPSSHNF
jgi:hypothetical protein